MKNYKRSIGKLDERIRHLLKDWYFKILLNPRALSTTMYTEL